MVTSITYFSHSLMQKQTLKIEVEISFFYFYSWHLPLPLFPQKSYSVFLEYLSAHSSISCSSTSMFYINSFLFPCAFSCALCCRYQSVICLILFFCLCLFYPCTSLPICTIILIVFECTLIVLLNICHCRFFYSIPSFTLIHVQFLSAFNQLKVTAVIFFPLELT